MTQIKGAATISRGYALGMGTKPESPWSSKWPQDDPQALTTFGERLAAARRFRGITKTQLAKLAKCSKGRISQIETGRPKRVDDVMTALAFRISDVLEVSARWLVWGTGPVAKWEPLTIEEKEVLTTWRALPEPLRDYAKTQLRALQEAIGNPAPSRAFPFQTPRASPPPQAKPRREPKA